MTIEYARRILSCSAAFNLSILLGWFLAFVLGRDRIYRLHSRWFRLSPERFDAIHYAGMAFYKLLILVFNIAPLAAIWMLSRP